MSYLIDLMSAIYLSFSVIATAWEGMELEPSSQFAGEAVLVRL